MTGRITETIPKPYLSCGYCQRNTDNGFVSVNVSLAKRRGILRGNYEGGMPVYLPIPDLVAWEILHDHCAVKAGRAEQTGDEFRIDAASIVSTKDLLELIADLVKRDWIVDTDLGNFLRRVIADTVFQFDVKAEKKRKKEEKLAGEMMKVG